MNYVTASCGHSTPACGSPNSLARRRCQVEPCHNCYMAECEALMTMEEAQAAYDAAVPVPMSNEEIDGIVRFVVEAFEEPQPSIN